MPVVSGVDYAGNAITIDPATDGPTMVVLLAHWCPHCNAEIPVLNEWRDSGDVPEGLDIVGVSTGVVPATRRTSRPTSGSSTWTGSGRCSPTTTPTTGTASAMAAYGGTSYPTLVLVDGDGVVCRAALGRGADRRDRSRSSTTLVALIRPAQH